LTSDKPKLLIVDDDEEIRTQTKWALADMYEITLAADRPTALAAFRDQRPAVVLLDLGLPPDPATTREGFQTLAGILSIEQSTKVIVITGQAEKDNAIRAVREGAYDFLPKPVDVDALKIILHRAFYLAEIEAENHKMQELWKSESFQGMLGTSPAMQQVFATIRKVANTNAPVLILGESGTGKEMAAQAIHARSERKDGPFVAINCGAIPENLLESELFGHEKGSFTGAHIQRVGKVEMAHGGTLFLDEIGELPLPLQVKILRFLQDQKVERIGGRREIPVDTRVIAATNIDIAKALKEGAFREDLYYRLAVVVLRLPGLRERLEDIPLLAQAFLRKFAAENRKTRLKFNAEALRAIQQHPWPGNVRELENRIKRAAIMAEGPSVTHDDLELASSATGFRTLQEGREGVERELVVQALQRHRGRISSAAVELGISRPTLYELMERLGIQKPDKSDTDHIKPPK
jgi:two-component system NtrC family response regulator